MTRRWVVWDRPGVEGFKLEGTTGEVWRSSHVPERWWWEGVASGAMVEGSERTRERAQQECERWLDAHAEVTS